MIWIPVGSHLFTTFAEASRFMRVTCEKCASVYGYEMTRQGRGSAVTLHTVNPRGTPNAAAKIADDIAHRLLEESCDPVPCPVCGWYQASMVAAFQTRFFPWTPWSDRQPFDPNRDYPRHCRLTPGAPDGFLIQPPPHPHPRIDIDPLPPIEPGDWITVRTSRLLLPALCCICMMPRDAALRLARDFDAPLCSTCLRQYQSRQLARTLAGGSCAFAISLLLACGVLGPFWGLRFEAQLLLFTACFFVALFGGYVGRKSIGSPICIGEFNLQTETARLGFANPDFRDAVRTHMAQARTAYIAAAEEQVQHGPCRGDSMDSDA